MVFEKNETSYLGPFPSDNKDRGKGSQNEEGSGRLGGMAPDLRPRKASSKNLRFVHAMTVPSYVMMGVKVWSLYGRDW